MNHSPSAESQRHGKVKLDRYRFIFPAPFFSLWKKPHRRRGALRLARGGFLCLFGPDYEFSRQARRNEWGGA